jgi:hypothetical protein
MKKALEIPEELLENVEYDENSPSGLIWIKPNHGRKLGDKAGCKNNRGYWQIGFSGKLYQCHRVIYKLFNKINIQNTTIDHEDRNPDNNTIENLRIANDNEQKFNTGIPITNKSGIKGVHWRKDINKWRAQIEANGKYYHLGYFDDKEEAGRIIKKKRDELHGEFANHGTNFSTKKTVNLKKLTIFDI